ncbi:hypothetical protein F8388_001821 [Cannabis sativa]|uniref:Uncharacterized protein n=1 Tax=Cannabis sativa TaxID=3483 RepID=A0A7J6F056_CANSA|nr:hypothetical protein F8388_001821 [Cannabis sativa]KAF4391438.1 hypothetical protein G4B88_005509 [Cannabis sativa]
MENEEENVDVEVQKSTGSIENEENENAKIEIPYLYESIIAETMLKKVENMMTSLYDFYQNTVVLPNSSNDQQVTENFTSKSNASGKECITTSVGTDTTTSGAL